MTGSSSRTFRRDWAQSIGASGVSFALTIISTPIMTRLFDPHQYGAFGIVSNASVFIVGFGLLGLPNALAGEFDRRQQRKLIVAATQLALLCAALVGLMAGGLLLAKPSIFGTEVPGLLPLLLPVLILCTAVQQIGDGIATSRNWLPSLAAGRVANAIVSRLFSLCAGWLVSPSAAAMVIGDGIGKCIQAMLALRRLPAYQRRPVHILRFRSVEFKSVVRCYRDFALYSNIATIVPVLVTLCIQLRIGASYSLSETGRFVLAQSIINLPTSLIALATAHVVFRHLVIAFNEQPSSLFRLSLKISGAYACMGMILMMPVVFLGPELFAFFFGGRWKPAGEFAAILSFPQMLAFSLTVLLSLFRITRRMRLWFFLELATAAVVLGCFYLAMPPDSGRDAVLLLATLLGIRQIVLHLGCLYVAYAARAGSFQIAYPGLIPKGEKTT